MRNFLLIALVLAAAGCSGCENEDAPAAESPAVVAPAAVEPAAAAASPSSKPAVMNGLPDPAHSMFEKNASEVMSQRITRRLGPSGKLKRMPERLRLNRQLIRTAPNSSPDTTNAQQPAPANP